VTVSRRSTALSAARKIFQISRRRKVGIVRGVFGLWRAKPPENRGKKAQLTPPKNWVSLGLVGDEWGLVVIHAPDRHV
jgi:hypothetical protein